MHLELQEFKIFHGVWHYASILYQSTEIIKNKSGLKYRISSFMLLYNVTIKRKHKRLQNDSNKDIYM